MHFTKRLGFILLVGLCLCAAQAQNATEEQIQKSREILNQIQTPDVPGNPSTPAQFPAADPSSSPAPKATPQPSPTPPKPPGALPVTASQQQRLDELMQRYRNGELGPAQYHQERAKILDKPAGFYQPKVDPPKPKPEVPSLAQPTRTPPASGPAPARPTTGTVPVNTAPGDKFLEAAFVPGADVVLRLDFKSARQAPVYAMLKALDDKRPKNDLAGGGSPLHFNELTRTLEKTLGLKEEDIEGLVLSADLDGTDLSQVGADPSSLKSIQGVLALQLAKAVTTEQVKQTILAVAREEGAQDVKVTETKIGSTSVLTLMPGSESDPEVHVAVQGGNTIFAGFNRESVAGALDRSGGQSVKLETAVSGALNMIAPGAQMKLGFVVPKAVKDLVTGLTQPGGGDAGSGAGAMLSGLMDIRSLALGVTLGQGLALSLSGDLGNADAANAASMLVTMMKPQFKASMAQQLGRSPETISDQTLTAAALGNLVNIKLSFDKELIRTWTQAKPSAASP